MTQLRFKALLVGAGIVGAVAVVASLGGILLLARGDSSTDEAGPAAVVTSEPSPHSELGGAPPEYVEAIPLVEGDYKPPAASTEAGEKYQAALASARSSPQFNGIVGDFRLYGWANVASDPSLEQKECVSVDFHEVKVMEYGYLIPGTKMRSPQYAGVCAEGSTAWVVQDFVFGYGTFTIGYELGERAIGHDATADRISAATVAGRPGVVIRPLIEEGNGQSIVAFELDKGFIVVGAQNLPLSETLKIAEGIKCTGC